MSSKGDESAVDKHGNASSRRRLCEVNKIDRALH